MSQESTQEFTDDGEDSFYQNFHDNSVSGEENIHFQATSRESKQTKMASSFADVAGRSVQSSSTEENVENTSVKPIFIKEYDIFGTTKPPKQFWLSHTEIYKAIGRVIQPQCIRGIQRIHNMWRIYLDNETDKMTILTQGIILRDKSISLHEHNPRYPRYDNTIAVRVKNIPLSADDGQIERALTMRNIEILSFNRDRLRVEGRLTNCETGDRLIVCKKFEKQLPRTLQIGKYLAKIFHYGQSTNTEHFLCNKCLQKGHTIRECHNEWTCRRCNKSGHQMLQCPEFLKKLEERQRLKENEHEEIIEQTHEMIHAESTQEVNKVLDNESEDQSQSQSILTSLDNNTKKSKQKKKTLASNDTQHSDASYKKDQTKTKSGNKQYEQQHEAKRQNQSKAATSKQTDMSSFITPTSRKSHGDKRTPPTPQDRENHKLPKR